MEVAKPVVARIELGEGVELVSEQEEVELGHLEGRADRPRHFSRFFTWEAPARKAEWVVRCTGEDTSPLVRVVAISQKGGTDSKTICLNGESK